MIKEIFEEVPVVANKAVREMEYRVPALEKGLDIMETLSVTSVPLSLTDLSKRLNRTPSELFRMVTLLERRGYIIREEHSGSYYLSLKLFELAHLHSPVEQLFKASSQPMRELARTIQQSCHLSVINGGELVVLSEEPSPDKVRVSVEVGARFSPFRTASGRTILSYMPDEDAQALIHASPYYGELDESETQALLLRLGLIREQGFEIVEHETHVGVRDIAVIVGNPRIGVAAALAVTCLIGSRKQSETMPILREMQMCASMITEALGLSPAN